MIFISYKSNTVNLVRLITEALMMNYIDAWFAEYQVLLKNYSVFQEAIDQGIANSKYAIFFTNEQWKNSKHCQYELDNLIHKLSPDNIIEIGLRTSEGESAKRYLGEYTHNFIDLHCDMLHPDIACVKYALSQIAIRLGITLNYSPEVFNLGEPFQLPNLGVSICTGRLNANLKENFFRVEDFLRPMVIFKGTYLNKEIGLMISLMPFESVLSEMSQNPNEEYDDQVLYQAYMDYAKDWQRQGYTNDSRHAEWETRTEGLHLLFSKSHSHFGLTYTTHYSKSNDEVMWERRYLMQTEESNHRGKGEASLVFYVKLSGDKSNQINDFCRFGVVFDEIARTFKYSTPKGKFRVINNFAPLTVKILYSILFFGLVFTFINHNENTRLVNIVLFFFGIFLFDLIKFCTSLTYQRITWLMQPVQASISTSSYEQISGSIFNMIFIDFFKILFGFIVSLKEIIKKPLKHIPLFLFILIVLGQARPLMLPNDVSRMLEYALSFCAGLTFGHSIVLSMLDKLTNRNKYYKKG